MQRFQLHPVFFEVRSQPFEQLGMTRRPPREAERVGVGHEAASEMVLPNTIHQDASQKRSRLAGHPLGKPKPTTGRLRLGCSGQVLGPIAEQLRHTHFRRWSEIRGLAANEHMNLRQSALRSAPPVRS